MATSVEPPPAPAATPQPDSFGMCLLHADYHPMSQACWSTALDWYLAHHHLPERERRDQYALEVERAMLDARIHPNPIDRTRPATTI